MDERNTPTNPEVRVSPEGLVAVRRPGLLDEWAVVAGPGNSWLADVRPGADEVYGWTPLVPAPVLEGLYREIDRLRDKLDEERQANSHETGHLDADRECMVQEIQRLRAEVERHRAQAGAWSLHVEQTRQVLADASGSTVDETRETPLHRLVQRLVAERGSERESRIAWACEADRLQQVVERLTQQLGNAADDLHARGLSEYGARPSVSDQTPATPDPAGFSVLVCDEPELHKQSGQHDDECWIDAGLLDAEPSSVQGDTTPADNEG